MFCDLKMKKVICAFDFDGTLITKDSFLEFIKFSHGFPYFILSFVLFSPVIVLYKLRIIPNYKAKQIMFSWFFKGWQSTDFDKKCAEYIDTITYESDYVYSKMLFHQKESHTVVIISASIENWVKPWAKKQGVDVVCSTQIEINDEGFLTGNFKSKNCYGKEKVKRLLELYPDRENYTLYVYGDSSGDKELFDLADYKEKV